MPGPLNLRGAPTHTYAAANPLKLRGRAKYEPVGHLANDPMARHSPAKAKLGSGKRFAALKASLARRGDVSDPGAVAAAIGRKKYGAKKMATLAASGRKRR